MASAKRYLLIVLTFAIVATIFTVFGPRTVHAITAALVQVVNTSANPVPIAESALRFQAYVCDVSGTVSTASGYCAPTPNTFTVPSVASTGAPVKRLVLTNVSGFCANWDNSALVLKEVRLIGSLAPDNSVNGDTSFDHEVPVGPPYSYTNAPNTGVFSNHPENDYTFGQTTNFAFIGGDTVTVRLRSFFPGTGSNDRLCSVRMEGYLVTQ